MNAERALSAVGVVLIAVGFAMMFVPGLAGAFQANELYLSVIGLGFVLQTVRVVNGRRKRPYAQTETDDPEVSQELPAPGDEFDDLLQRAGRARHSGRERDTVRERLRAAAIAVVARADGVSREQAVARIEDGSWTDDPYAAAFFTGRLEGASLVSRLSLFDRSRSHYERWAEHAAREVIRLSEEGSR